MTLRTLVVTVSALLFVASCGAIDSSTSRNESICPAGYRTSLMNPAVPLATEMCVSNGRDPVPIVRTAIPRAIERFGEDARSPDVFVGVAISGGGSRAANFGLATLRQLEEIGLLRNVSAVSTTSGGGLPGALYAMRGRDIDWEDAKTLMRTDFVAHWVRKNLNPLEIVMTSVTHKDRSDLMAEVFDDVLFDNARYSKLGAFEVGSRPIWLANTTDSMRGGRFPISQARFEQLHSNLATFPLSYAVTASAAFPGGFNAVTLTNYLALEWDPRVGHWRDPLKQYEHLIDGGPIDNLGVEALLELAASQAQTRSGASPVGKEGSCLIIVVDAYPSGVPNRKTWQADPRAWYDHLVDLNFLDAFDVLLARRRTDLLSYVGLEEGDRGGRISQSHFSEFDVAFDDVGGARLSTALRARPGSPIPEGYFRCAAWHVNLSGLQAVARYRWDQTLKRPIPVQGDAHGNDPLMKFRFSLHSVVSQIDTDFRLKGPRDCPEKLLQDSLYAAAFILVRQDEVSRTRACTWATSRGLRVNASCGQFPSDDPAGTLSLDGVEPDSPRLATGRVTTEAVKCRSPT